jgi:hypothetical protein
MRVYDEALFRNLCSFLDSCFPVARALLGEARWRQLNRAFYRDWPLHTPWFREIPREFVRYLQNATIRQPLPRWLAALAHYEWAELAVDIMDTQVPPHDRDGDLMHASVVVNPALMNLAYAWPVHRVGPDYRPRQPCAVNLLVFRDREEEVQFVEVNVITAQLLSALMATPCSGRQACLRMAEALSYPDPDALLHFAASLLDTLRHQGILLGTQPISVE